MITITGTTSVGSAFVLAAATRKGVVVRWQTRTESGVAGFNVYRGSARPNQRLVAAAGSTRGHAYSWLDRTKLRGRTYRIQGLIANGSKVWLGSTRS